ncbi:MAG: hypothetical protein WD852_10435 [Methyloceanibacter sp.]
MSYPSPALDGFDALWQHPLRWFSRQFLVYGTVAAVTAVAIIIGSGLYALVVPVEQVPLPEQKPEIITPAPLPTPIQPKKDQDLGALISALPAEPIGKSVYVQGTKFGTVDKMIVDANGKIYAYVISRSDPLPENAPRTFTVPSTAIQWHEAGANGETVPIGELQYEAVRSAP